MLNSQRGISYLPTGHGSKEKWAERQERRRQEEEDAYAEYVPKQNFDKRDLREISRGSKRS